MRKFIAALVLAVIIAGCSPKTGGNGSTDFTFEQACRLNGFSWIDRQPQQGGVALLEKTCLGCTVDGDNHFCQRTHEEDFRSHVAVMSDFRDACKVNGAEWMLMQPTRNNVELSERLCWGCMTDSLNHFCEKEEYLNFENSEQ